MQSQRLPIRTGIQPTRARWAFCGGYLCWPERCRASGRRLIVLIQMRAHHLIDLIRSHLIAISITSYKRQLDRYPICLGNRPRSNLDSLIGAGAISSKDDPNRVNSCETEYYTSQPGYQSKEKGSKAWIRSRTSSCVVIAASPCRRDTPSRCDRVGCSPRGY